MNIDLLKLWNRINCQSRLKIYYTDLCGGNVSRTEINIIIIINDNILLWQMYAIIYIQLQIDECVPLSCTASDKWVEHKLD